MLKDKIENILKKSNVEGFYLITKQILNENVITPTERKMKKKFEAQFIANKILKDQIKETI
jgi:predicted nucleic acid-binding protein